MDYIKQKLSSLSLTSEWNNSFIESGRQPEKDKFDGLLYSQAITSATDVRVVDRERYDAIESPIYIL